MPMDRSFWLLVLVNVALLEVDKDVVVVVVVMMAGLVVVDYVFPICLCVTVSW